MSTRIAKALLSRGMFPKELPPVFTTKSLGTKFKAIKAAVPPANPKKDWTKPERYSLPKAKLGRRTSHVVNPVAYFRLCEEIASNWKAIRQHLDKSSISAHTPGFFGAKRALRSIDFKKIRERRILDGSGHMFVLTTDFARFFPTIYTHSVPWALHTKSIAKANIANTAYFGNVLDKRLMCLQEGQTAGIPVGPDASYILAEIVAVAIDNELSALAGKAQFGLRYVDDFTLFFATRSDAEKALSHIAAAAGEFQLELNPLKTSIRSLEDETAEGWVFALAAFQISTKERGQRDSLVKFTELCISLHTRNGDGAIGKYGIKKISSSVISAKNIDFAVACVLRLCAISPSAVPDVVSFLRSYVTAGYKVDRTPIRRFIENVVVNCVGLNHHMEVCWALWLAYESKIKLPKSTVSLLEKSNNSIVVIVAMLLHEAKLLCATAFVPQLASVAPDVDSFQRDTWLLHYEGARRGWFGWTDTELKKSILAPLHGLNISFLDKGATAPGILETRPGAGPITAEQIESATLRELLSMFTTKPAGFDYGVAQVSNSKGMLKIGEYGEYGESY